MSRGVQIVVLLRITLKTYLHAFVGDECDNGGDHPLGERGEKRERRAHAVGDRVLVEDPHDDVDGPGGKKDNVHGALPHDEEEEGVSLLGRRFAIANKVSED